MATPTPKQGEHRRRSVRIPAELAAFSIGFVATIAIAGALHLLVDRSAWHMDLPRTFRTAILAWTLTQTLPLAAAVGLLTMISRGRRRVAAGVVVFILVAVLLMLFGSWAMFWGTGQFLSRDALVFALASPASSLAHVVQLSPFVALLVPMAAVAGAVGLVAAARRVPESAASLALLPLAAIIVTAWSLQTNRTAETYLLRSTTVLSHPEVGTPMLLADLIEDLREDRSGPIAHLLATRRHGELQFTPSDDIPVEWRARAQEYVTPAPRGWNVIVLIVESLRSDELRSYGATLDVMPAVNMLADESLVFVEHRAVASHSSYSSVVPVSSQFPLRDPRLHLYPEDPPYPRILLYDLLKPFGYRTAIISSQNERWGGMANFLASAHVDHFFHAETFDGDTYSPEEDTGFARFTATYGRAGKIDDRATIDEAIRWIGDGHGEPFFTYINLQNSHVPYPIPADAPTPFGPRKPSFPIRFNYFPPDSADVVRGVYRNALYYVDRQIARLIEHLKATGQWESTVFAVMGDHGQAFFEHGFAAHGNQLYEELLRTPLLIRVPGTAAEVRHELAQHVDVAPTILEILGMAPHPGFQGVSLLSGERTFAYATVQTPMANQYSVFDGRFKLVLDGRSASMVLRDLAGDPDERSDWKMRQPQETETLRERLETWHSLQIEYYSNPLLQVSRYAPVLKATQHVAASDTRTGS